MKIEGKTYILVKKARDPKADVYFVDGKRGGQYIFTVFKNGEAFLLNFNTARQIKVTTWSMAA